MVVGEQVVEHLPVRGRMVNQRACCFRHIMRKRHYLLLSNMCAHSLDPLDLEPPPPPLIPVIIPSDPGTLELSSCTSTSTRERKSTDTSSAVRFMMASMRAPCGSMQVNQRRHYKACTHG